jgi:hypothetical protein
MAELIVLDATAAPGSPTQRTFAELKARHHPNLKGGLHYVESERHANYVEVDTFIRTLAEVKANIVDGTELPVPGSRRVARLRSITRRVSTAGRS